MYSNHYIVKFNGSFLGTVYWVILEWLPEITRRVMRGDRLDNKIMKVVVSETKCRFMKSIYCNIHSIFAITSRMRAHSVLHRTIFKQNRTLNVKILVQSKFRTFFLIGMRIIVFLRHFFSISLSLQFDRVGHVCACVVWPDFPSHLHSTRQQSCVAMQANNII